MEISPISGIRGLPVLKPRSPDADLAALSDIEHVTHLGDETYTPSDGKAAEGAEDDEDDLIDQPELEEPEAGSPTPASHGGAINFFV
jgi:hypothetical protein